MMKSEVFINNCKFTVRDMSNEDNPHVVQLTADDTAIETYECKDKHEWDITFNTIRDTLAHVSKHALSK